MRRLSLALISFCAASAMYGQKLEFGVVGGGSFLDNVTASGTTCCGTAGFAPGFVAGVFVGHNLYSHFAGEIRYEYTQSNLRLASGSQTSDFSGRAHAVHYDLRYHTNISHSPAQFFAAAGGGIKAFDGNGAEAAYQPLSQFGFFTKTSQIKPMFTAAAGITVSLGGGFSIRGEVRDFITGFPTKVLTPPTGIKYGSVLQSVVPMVSLVWSK